MSIDTLRDKHKSRYMLPTRTLRLLECCFEGTKYDIAHGELRRPTPSLTKQERVAIQSLNNNKDVSITKADKGDTTVIMSTNHLVQLAHTHLSDQKTCMLLTHDPTTEVVRRLNQKCQAHSLEMTSTKLLP